MGKLTRMKENKNRVTICSYLSFTLKSLWIFACFATSLSLSAQEEKPKNYSLSGYLKSLQTVSFQDINGDWLTNNFLHNRLNFKWYPSQSLTVVAELRNRFFYGEFVKGFPQYADLLEEDNGFFNLSHNIVEEKSFFLHTILDRAYLDWSSGKWQVRLGRQRINWGQNFVWNPNDIFNTYSFFDFDYEERPGSDALLIRFYSGLTSSIEFASTIADNVGDWTAAALFKINKWEYDFQFLGGKNKKDLVVGTGWSGQLGQAGFKGEVTYFYPYEEQDKFENSVIVATTSVDYTFSSSLFLHGEFIFNNKGKSKEAGPFNVNEPLTAKTLTQTKFSLFAESSYQITPLLKSGVSGIFNPGDNSYFIGPSIDLSITDNLSLFLIGQIFDGPNQSLYNGIGTFIFSRFKWSF